MRSDKHTHISASEHFSGLRLRELWDYRYLSLLFTKRRLSVSYKQTILGPLWLWINPLLTSLIYVLLFGNIARLSTDGVPQLLFYLSGTAFWGCFSFCVNRNASLFTENASLFSKVYFPRLVMSVSYLLSAILQLLIQLFPLFLLWILYLLRGSIHPCWCCALLLPPAILLLGLLGTGVGIIISSLTTKYRDLSILVSFGLQLWMYGSAVVYPLSTLSGSLRTLVLCNPVSGFMELFRFALFGSGSILWWNLAYALVFTLCVDAIGILIFHRIERSFVDTI